MSHLSSENTPSSSIIEIISDISHFHLLEAIIEAVVKKSADDMAMN